MATPADAAVFPVPQNAGHATWEAEAARVGAGWTRVQHAWASAGSYVASETPNSDSTLEFGFRLDRPTRLSVRPVWWRHGERRPAKRFPYPFKPQLAQAPVEDPSVGPEVLAACGRLVFFTAPAAGRIGVFDAEAEKLMDPIDIAGYPADMVVDERSGRLYIADAARDRVVVIDARQRKVLSEIRTPGCPWSLALKGSQLFVGCMKGKCLAKIDLAQTRVVKTVDLQLAPLGVEVANGQVVVRLQPLIFDPASLQEEAADRLFYHVLDKRKAGFPDPMPVVVRWGRYYWPAKVFESPKAHVLRAREKPWGKELTRIDVSRTTKAPAKAEVAWPLSPKPGPDVLDEFGKVLFFTAPSAGRVGVLDMESDTLLEPVHVGGYPADLVVHVKRKKVYVADAAGHRVVVLDAEGRKVLRTIDVPRMPIALALAGDRLFVACHSGRRVAVVDTARDELAQRIDLPGRADVLAADLVRLYPSYTCLHRWGLFYPPESEAPVRLVVRLAPLAFDAGTLEQASRSSAIPEPTKRNRVQLTWRVSDRQTPPATDLSAPGLVASWGFWPDRAAAQAGRDLGPHERHGKVVKAAPVATDAFGYALRLNGVDASVDCAADPAFTPTEALTVEAWVRWQGPGPHPEDPAKESPSSCIVGNRGPNTGYMLMVDRSGRAAFGINGLGRNDHARDMVHSSRRLDRDKWAHVVGTYNAAGGTLGVFVNGTRSHKRTDKRLRPTPSALAIGAQCAKSRYYLFKGDIAQVRLYARVLPQKEIAANYEKLQSERTKSFVAGETHALQVNGSKWVDVSRVTDPQRRAEPSRIGPGDTPGTLTLAVDDGPEHDWTRGIWITPADGRYLVADTDEFWRWNAPTFTLAPGRHVLRVCARGAHANLDALRVACSLEGRVAVKLLPEPQGTHRHVPIPNYHGVFYHGEPVRLTLQVTSTDQAAHQLRVEHIVKNFMGDQVATGRHAASLAPGKSWEQPLDLAPKEFGIFEAKVVVDSPDGRLVKQSWFLRLPKLEHPRLLLRRDEMDEIRARIQQYPRLFARYRTWLRQQCEQPGFLRESLLDKYPCKAYKHEPSKWRVVACQLAATFLGSDTSDFFAAKVAPLIKGGYRDSGGVGQYVHNCFPSAPVCLADMAAFDSAQMRERIDKQFSGSLGNSSYLAESLLALAEPLTPRMRAVLDRQMMWVLNVDRYFAVHAGKRGGNWWTSERTGCCCPLHGVARAFLFYRQAFGLERLFERPAMGGLFTHHAYVHPRFDARGYFPHFLAGGEGRGSAVMRDVVPCLAKQPVEIARRDWTTWVRQLDKPNLSEQDADKLFRGYLGDLVPWFLALGWFDPSSPQVRWEELPPTVLFDGEGEVVMHSDMTPDLTRVYFSCGIRDIVYRGQPSHFEVMNAGQVLIGTGSLCGDHVQPVPSWGNVVAVGHECLDWWRSNVGHRRGMDQHLVMNRHSHATETYVPRDQQLCGYREPGGAGTGYTLGFHTHGKHPFVREGQIVAYETWPQFDYVAGDATNAWRPSDVSYAYRQVLFVPSGRGEPQAERTPDVLIVYDRVRLKARDKDVRWLAAAASHLLVEGNTFLVENRPAVLRGQVLLPKAAQLKSANPYQGFAWRFQQRVLEIRPQSVGDEVEFLVVMLIAKGAPPSLDRVKPVESEGHVGAAVSLGQKRILALFRRGAPVGGRIQIQGVPRPIDRAFVAKVDDGYRHWQSYPQWKAWTTEPRFRFICPRP